MAKRARSLTLRCIHWLTVFQYEPDTLRKNVVLHTFVPIPTSNPESNVRSNEDVTRGSGVFTLLTIPIAIPPKVRPAIENMAALSPRNERWTKPETPRTDPLSTRRE